jgi:predicted DCC family thiol-disulfide oxidoreductase YuxK
MPTEQTTCTVYFDGSCPLCSREISYYQSQEGAQAISFVDVSSPDAELGPGLERAQSLARLHVRERGGQLVSGAAAFVSLWRTLPRLAWLARIAQLPGVLPLLEGGYRGFLVVRPFIHRLVGVRRKNTLVQ